MPPWDLERLKAAAAAELEQEARQEADRDQALNQADARSADDAFKRRVSDVISRTYPGRPQIPVAPLAGGTDVTADVIARLDAANEDAANKLRAAQDELADVKRRLAEAQAKKP